MSAPAGRRLLVGVVILVVLAVIVTAMVLLGPPSEERSRRLDARRVSDLEGIVSSVTFYRHTKGRMPVSLEEVGQERALRLSTDPLTGAPYEYRVVESDAYELCATFERPSEPRVRSGVDQWAHAAGRQCFARRVDLPKEK